MAVSNTTMVASDARIDSHRSGTHSRRFDGRVALVTGAGSGIGRAVARRLLGEGGHVALFGRTASKLESVAAEMSPEQTLVIEGRHEIRDDVTRAIENVEKRWGRLDILVNNAGTYTTGTVAETDDSTWSESLATNVTGPFLMTREALPLLRAARGVIVNNATTLALKPIPGAAAYAIAKAALVMLTRATALEEAAKGVRALAVCPGVVDTPIHSARPGSDPANPRAFLEQAAAFHPIGRVGTPDEVAALVLFFASDESAWSTGSIVTIDGGISLA